MKIICMCCLLVVCHTNQLYSDRLTDVQYSEAILVHIYLICPIMFPSRTLRNKAGPSLVTKRRSGLIKIKTVLAYQKENILNIYI